MTGRLRWPDTKCLSVPSVDDISTCTKNGCDIRLGGDRHLTSHRLLENGQQVIAERAHGSPSLLEDPPPAFRRVNVLLAAHLRRVPGLSDVDLIRLAPEDVDDIYGVMVHGCSGGCGRRSLIRSRSGVTTCVRHGGHRGPEPAMTEANRGLGLGGDISGACRRSLVDFKSGRGR